MNETSLMFSVSIICYIVSLFFLQRLVGSIIKKRRDPKAAVPGLIQKNAVMFAVSFVVFWGVYLFGFFGGSGFEAKDILPFAAGNLIGVLLGFVGL